MVRLANFEYTTHGTGILAGEMLPVTQEDARHLAYQRVFIPSFEGLMSEAYGAPQWYVRSYYS
jgi:hypothetical protein